MFSCGTIASEKRIADQAAVLAVMHIDMPSLAGVKDAGDGLAVLVLDVDQHRRADRIEVPYVVGDILEVTDVFSRVEVERNERVGIEIVARAVGTVQIGRRVADHEVDPVGSKIDRGVLPHAAAELGKRIAGLGQLILFGLDVAVHIAAGRVLGGPDAYGAVRNGIEIPDLLARVGVIGAHESADAVFATIGADQHLVLDHSRSHRLAVAQLGIGNVGSPHHLAVLGIQSDQLGVERGEIDLVVENLDAAIVRPAAEGRDRPHLVIVVPELLAGLGIKRVDMAERGRDEHYAIDDDR
jgi:hypothetical protein